MQEDPEIFQAAMREVGEAHIRAAEWLLSPANSGELGFAGEHEDFAQYLWNAAGLWAQNHLGALAEDRRNVFLHAVCTSSMLSSFVTHHLFLCLSIQARFVCLGRNL